MSIGDNELFNALFAYYRDLLSRRWQYFAGFLVVDGILLNVWIGVDKSNNPLLSSILCVAAIVISIAFLRLLSRSRKRINDIGLELNQLVERQLMSSGNLGVLGLGGITMWLYFSIIVLTLPWFIILWRYNPILMVATAVIFLGALTAVEWSLNKSSSII